MNFVDIVGFTAGIFTTSASVPQIIKFIRTKKTRDVSTMMNCALFIGISLWGTYGYLISSIPMLVTNSISLCTIGIILYLKFKYRNNS